MSERDKAGLRGPVKTVVEEQTFALPDGKQRVTTNRTEYAPDGRILEERWGNSDGSEQATKYSYHSDGRLSKIQFGKTGSAPDSETTYLYDDARRMIGLQSGDKTQVRYQYDDRGRKLLTQSFEATPLPANTAYATHWEGTDLGFASYLGGTLTTFYNEHDVATGAEFRDLEGKLVGHIARKFDSEGRVKEEQQFADAPAEFPFPEEIRSQLNLEQLKAMNSFAAGMQNRINSYSYDAQGRVTERHRRGGPFDDEVTITRYNDHGDKGTERTTTVMNPIAGRQFSLTKAGAVIPIAEPKPSPPASVYEIQYSYQYDGYGNWTEQTVVNRSEPDGTPVPGSSFRRKLTYY